MKKNKNQGANQGRGVLCGRHAVADQERGVLYGRHSVADQGRVVLYGRHAVSAALENPARKIYKVMVLPENAAEMRAKYPALQIVTADKKEFEKILPATAVHQGYALQTAPLEPVTLEEICEKAQDKEKCVVLILDQVTDPQNVGAIVRSAAAFGAMAVVVQDKNSPVESGAMAKAAAGTLELVPMVRATNLSRALETLKNNGFWVVGMDGYAQKTISSLDKNRRLAVVMGSEGAGMRRLVEQSCDLTVRLPICDNVESLNVSTAAAVVLYEIAR